MWGNIKIYDFDNNLVQTLRTANFNLVSAEKKSIPVEFDSEGLVPGQYFARAEIHMDDEVTQLENSFNVGTLDVQIKNVSGNYTSGQINKLIVKVESRWKGKITNLYIVPILDGVEQQATPYQTLEAFEKKNLTTYLDLTYTEAGQHNLKTILNYGGQQSYDERSITVVGQPKEKPFNLGLPNTLIIMMILMIIVLILILVVLLFEQKKRK